MARNKKTKIKENQSSNNINIQNKDNLINKGSNYFENSNDKKNNNYCENCEINIEIWKTCVEMSNNISIRRDTTNNLFITLNTAILGLVVFKESSIETQMVCLIGLCFCHIWFKLIQYFKNLNIEKFNIINNLEKNFHLQPFNKEWELLKANPEYLDATKIEPRLPYIFSTAYFILLIKVIVSFDNCLIYLFALFFK